MIRIFDFLASLIGILILSPLLVLISCLVLFDAGLPVIYIHQRVGRNGRIFPLLKFRTMKKNAAKTGALTIGSRDPRVTRSGYLLRKSKLDELPQLFNVLVGQMSFVGPRPEVQKYVDLYSDEQRRVLQVRPGITDLASLEYIRENDLLAQSENPEKTYIEVIMPDKLRINLDYLSRRTIWSDLNVILKTIGKMTGIN